MQRFALISRSPPFFPVALLVPWDHTSPSIERSMDSLIYLLTCAEFQPHSQPLPRLHLLARRYEPEMMAMMTLEPLLAVAIVVVRYTQAR